MPRPSAEHAAAASPTKKRGKAAGPKGKKKAAKKKKKNSDEAEKAKTEVVEKESSVFLNLADDVLFLIMSCLSPLDMLHFARCASGFDGLLTHESVGRAIYIAGTSREMQVLSLLVRDVDDMHVLLPSPLRLLQLCLARTCEACSQSHVGKFAHHMYRDGVSLCRRCYQARQSSNFDNEYVPEVSKLIMQNVKHEDYLWQDPYFSSSGQRCGPVWSFTDVETVDLDGGTAAEYLASLEVYEDTYDSFVNEIESIDYPQKEEMESMITAHDKELNKKHWWRQVADDASTDESEKEAEEWGYKRPWYKRCL